MFGATFRNHESSGDEDTSMTPLLTSTCDSDKHSYSDTEPPDGVDEKFAVYGSESQNKDDVTKRPHEIKKTSPRSTWVELLPFSKIITRKVATRKTARDSTSSVFTEERANRRHMKRRSKSFFGGLFGKSDDSFELKRTTDSGRDVETFLSLMHPVVS